MLLRIIYEAPHPRRVGLPVWIRRDDPVTLFLQLFIADVICNARGFVAMFYPFLDTLTSCIFFEQAKLFCDYTDNFVVALRLSPWFDTLWFGENGVELSAEYIDPNILCLEFSVGGQDDVRKGAVIFQHGVWSQG